MNFLKIAFWNIYGAINKNHELEEIAPRNNLDVVELQEIFLLEDKRFSLEGYEIYREEEEEQQS